MKGFGRIAAFVAFLVVAVTPAKAVPLLELPESDDIPLVGILVEAGTPLSLYPRNAILYIDFMGSGADPRPGTAWDKAHFDVKRVIDLSGVEVECVEWGGVPTRSFLDSTPADNDWDGVNYTMRVRMRVTCTPIP